VKEDSNQWSSTIALFSNFTKPQYAVSSNYGVSKGLRPKKWESGWKKEDEKTGAKHAVKFENNAIVELH